MRASAARLESVTPPRGSRRHWSKPLGGDPENGSYLQSQFRRLKGRRGPKKPIVAVAASMLTAAYFILRDETDYHDLGGRYLADRDKHHITQRLLRRLHDLGVEVEVKVA